jgi:hypothetical protein
MPYAPAPQHFLPYHRNEKYPPTLKVDFKKTKVRVQQMVQREVHLPWYLSVFLR